MAFDPTTAKPETGFDPSSAKPAPAPKVEKPPKDERSFLDRIGRQLGLTARAGATGILGLPLIAGEGVNAISNAALEGAGYSGRGTGSIMGGFQDILTDIGLPKPEGAIERVAGDVATGMAAAGTMGPASTASILAGGGGGGGSGTAREMGGGPLTQMIAGLAGGVGLPMGWEALKGGGRSILGLMEPWFAGKERIVGKTLNTFATNPKNAAEAAGKAGEIVPGSAPTTAQATRDPGLAVLERGAAASDPKIAGRLQERAMEQNAARMSQVDDVVGSPAALAVAKEARDAEKGRLLQAAFGEKKPADTANLAKHINDTISSPKGDREVVKSALEWVKGRLYGTSHMGKEIPGIASKDLKADPERLYSLRQDIDDAMMGRLAGDQSKFALARKELGEVKKVLDDAIEAGAPGFKDYVTKFREMSGPVNKMEVLQDVRSKLVTASQNAKGDEVLSLAGFKRHVIDNPDVQKVLTNPDKVRMEKVLMDLNRGNSSANSGRFAGSDTIQKMSSANLIGRVIGGELDNSIIKSLARPIDFVYQIPNAQMKEMLADALMDPNLARLMMAKANQENLTAIGTILKQRMKDYAVGGTIGAGVTASD